MTWRSGPVAAPSPGKGAYETERRHPSMSLFAETPSYGEFRPASEPPGHDAAPRRPLAGEKSEMISETPAFSNAGVLCFRTRNITDARSAPPGACSRAGEGLQAALKAHRALNRLRARARQETGGRGHTESPFRPSEAAKSGRDSMQMHFTQGNRPDAAPESFIESKSYESRAGFNFDENSAQRIKAGAAIMR